MSTMPPDASPSTNRRRSERGRRAILLTGMLDAPFHTEADYPISKQAAALKKGDRIVHAGFCTDVLTDVHRPSLHLIIGGCDHDGSRQRFNGQLPPADWNGSRPEFS